MSRDVERSPAGPQTTGHDAATHGTPGRSNLPEADHGEGSSRSAAGSLFAGGLPWAGGDHEAQDQDHEQHAGDSHDAELAHSTPITADDIAAQADEQRDDSRDVGVARDGVAGAGGALPFGDQIQRSFGKHDISGVRSHHDDKAVAANHNLGAHAYAHGNNVAFGRSPDLHTAAHEAAHVLQQRSGVSFKGVDKPSDPHEAHADAVADAVVAGRSAENLIEQAPRGAASGMAVQRKSKHGDYAKTDGFNRAQVDGRPSVANDVHVKHALPRFAIVDGKTTRPHDTLDPGSEVTINVAHTRKLDVGECVLVRTVNQGVAWAPIAHVVKPGAVASIKKRTNKLSHKLQSHRMTGKQLHKAANNLMQFKKPTKTTTSTPDPADPTKTIAKDEIHAPTHLPADQKQLSLTYNRDYQSQAEYNHYLYREPTTRMDKGADVHHQGFYNIVMNLPQPGVVPVQVDVAVPGTGFFVLTKRQVALYKDLPDGAKRKVAPLARHVTWVFGCAAKLDGNGKPVPDNARRGWVPKDALEPTTDPDPSPV